MKRPPIRCVTCASDSEWQQVPIDGDRRSSAALHRVLAKCAPAVTVDCATGNDDACSTEAWAAPFLARLDLSPRRQTALSAHFQPFARHHSVTLAFNSTLLRIGARPLACQSVVRLRNAGVIAAGPSGDGGGTMMTPAAAAPRSGPVELRYTVGLGASRLTVEVLDGQAPVRMHENSWLTTSSGITIFTHLFFQNEC